MAVVFWVFEIKLTIFFISANVFLLFPCPSFHQGTTVAKYTLHANEGHQKTNFATICIVLEDSDQQSFCLLFIDRSADILAQAMEQCIRLTIRKSCWIKLSDFSLWVHITIQLVNMVAPLQLSLGLELIHSVWMSHSVPLDLMMVYFDYGLWTSLLSSWKLVIILMYQIFNCLLILLINYHNQFYLKIVDLVYRG